MMFPLLKRHCLNRACNGGLKMRYPPYWPQNLLLLFFLILFLFDYSISSAQPKPVDPSKRDKCIVCGMFLYKYPRWTPQIHFKDGKVEHFCSNKCMFAFYLNLSEFVKKKSKDDIKIIYVRNYYDLKWVDAMKCFFVRNSDVYGPMGRELIPLKSREEVTTFLEDHGGEIIQFENITKELIKELSKGETMMKFKK